MNIWDKMKSNPILWGGTAIVAVIALFLLLTPRARADSLLTKSRVVAEETTLSSTAARWSSPWLAGVLGYGIEHNLDTRESVFGGAAGWDYQFAGTKFVAGIGGDVTWTARHGDAQWALYGRGGYLLTPSLLAYAGAGIAQPAGDVRLTDSKLVVLGGLEAMVGSGWFVKAEGRWLDPDIDDKSDRYAAMLFVGYRFGGK